jgi:hypothetical protein
MRLTQQSGHATKGQWPNRSALHQGSISFGRATAKHQYPVKSRRGHAMGGETEGPNSTKSNIAESHEERCALSGVCEPFLNWREEEG